jgi:hypothetical protein
MGDLSCEEFASLAPELALNIVCGRERASALTHLDECGPCRARISSLTDTAEQLVEIVPARPPPAGFEVRVLNTLRANPQQRSSSPLRTAAILLVIAMVGVSGWLIGRARPATENATIAGPSVLYAPVLTVNSERIGEAYLYPDQPSRIYLALSTPTPPSSSVHCDTVRAHISTPIGSFPLIDGHGQWSIPADTQDVALIATVTDDSGRFLASALLTPRPPHNNPAPTVPGPQPPQHPHERLLEHPPPPAPNTGNPTPNPENTQQPATPHAEGPRPEHDPAQPAAREPAHAAPATRSHTQRRPDIDSSTTHSHDTNQDDRAHPHNDRASASTTNNTHVFRDRADSHRGPDHQPGRDSHSSSSHNDQSRTSR